MPLARKIPKRGFNNKRFRVVFEVVSLGRIGGAFVEGSVVDRESLVAKGLVRGRDGVCVKVLGSGDLCKRLVFRSVSFSSAARAKAAASGSSLE
jgi:large subunit ribosomal protein L15